MKKIKLMAIVPYDGLAEAVSSVAGMYCEQIETTVKVGNLQQGLAFGQQAERDGYDVILSRGGTAELLVKNLSVPVVNIEASGYDYMRAIKMATTISGSKAIVGYSYITNHAKSVLPLLDADIRVETIQSSDEILPLLKQLIKDGCLLVIGDVATHRAAKEIGMNAILVTSGEESIISAFNTVIRLMSSFGRLKERTYALEKMLQLSPTTVAVIDANGQLNYQSRPLEEIGLSLVDLVRYVDPDAQRQSYDFIERKGSRLYSIRLTWDKEAIGGPGTIFLISTQMIHNKDIMRGVEIENFSTSMRGSAELLACAGLYPEETISDAISFSGTVEPVLISGRAGIGKHQLARGIHRCSDRWQLPFVTIDCKSADPSAVLDALLPADAPTVLHAGATFCLRDIDSLSAAQQQSLYTKILSLDGGVWRFIATTRKLLPEQDEVSNVNRSLSGFFSLRLNIPRINYTVQDMERFVNLNIIEFNSVYGKQIVGMTTEAMELLLQYKWESDFESLRQTVGQLVFIAHPQFISAEDVARTMQNRRPVLSESGICPKGTLEEIELEIIRQVLAEENGNHSRTAARLGIGRSTLWRKLGNAGWEKE